MSDYHKKRETLYFSIVPLLAIVAGGSGALMYSEMEEARIVNAMSEAIAAKRLPKEGLEQVKKHLFDSFSSDRATFEKAVRDIVGDGISLDGGKLYIRNLVEKAINQNLG